MNKCLQVTCSAPVNIAVIKYWGKRDVELILPINSSLSVTLDQDDLASTTAIRCGPDLENDQMWLNGSEEFIKQGGRISAVLTRARDLRRKMEENNEELQPMSEWKVWIKSVNSFPTAAGLASSASGYACLTFTLGQLFELPCTMTELSGIARLGSGSACRSLFGGFVAWEKGENADGSDSLAVQVAPKSHWDDLVALILVVSDAQKDIGSSVGMQETVRTSPLLQARINAVPQNMNAMKEAIAAKDFDKFAELTMRDSNQFHAVCLDTFPPISYMNDISRKIVQVITRYNAVFLKDGPNGKQGYRCAYTFDAGYDR